MTKKEYTSPEMVVIQLKHNAALMQGSNVDPGDKGGTVGKIIGLAPFEKDFRMSFGERLL